MKREIIGGFVVRELPSIKSNNENEVAKCWICGSYSTRKEMSIKDNRCYCKKCK